MSVMGCAIVALIRWMTFTGYRGTACRALLPLAFVMVACGGPQHRSDATPIDARCSLPAAPLELHREGEAVLLVWELTWHDVWSQAVLPESDGLTTYRQGILDANAALREPVADPPVADDAAMEEIWRREFANRDVAYAGEAGTIRPIQCFEALFFAYQTDRVPQLTQPTEFIVAALTREVDGQTHVKIYFAAGDEMFPPKAVYPFEHAETDVADGWTFWTMLHNHTVQSLEGAPALGVPVPSTSDVALSLALAEQLGLESIRVTNGFYTIDIPAALLERYEGPPPQ